MVGKSENNSTSGRKNGSLRGCCQGQFNYCGRGIHHAGGRYLPSHISGPTVPTVAPLRWPPLQVWCEICEVRLSSQKNMEHHKNGKRHRRLVKQHEELQRQKAINGQESGQRPNYSMNLVVQPEKVQNSEKNVCLVENVSSEATINNHKDYLQKDRGKTSEDSAEEPEGGPRDNFAAQVHGFKHKIGGSRAGAGKCKETDIGIRRTLESSKPEQSIPFTCEMCSTSCQSQAAFESHLNSTLHQLKLEHFHSCQALYGEGGSQFNALSNYVVSKVQVPAIAPPPGPVASQILTPTPMMGTIFELQLQHVPSSRIEVSEDTEHHEIQNPTGERKDQPRSISVEVNVPAGSSINTQTEDVSSSSAAIAIAPSLGPVASQVFAPTPAVRSSFEPQIQHVLCTQVSEDTATHQIQNPTGERKDHPQSISVEVDLLAVSSINTRPEDASSSSAAIAIAIAPPPVTVGSQVFAPMPAVRSSFEPQIQHVLRTQVSEDTTHHEIQNPTNERKDQPRSISVELDVPAGSSIATQTEHVSSSSAAIAIATPLGFVASQIFAPIPAVRSSFEPEIQHVLHTQVSEAVEEYESQNPNEETNIQPLSSVLVEIDAPAGSNTNTQRADGSSKAEENMRVLTTELGITQLSEVTVCLKCGDRGFPETLVFCNKCQVYALHRYCLDGPVIFVEDVTWFCEDCGAKLVDTSSHDQSTPLLSGTSDSVSLAKDAIHARDLTNCINRLKKNKQQQQKIGKKLKKREVIYKQWHQNIGKKLKKRKVFSEFVAKTKVLLCDSHSSPHHEQTQRSNNCEEENKFKKECEPVPRDAANSTEGSDNVQISRVATNDDLDFLESYCHTEAQPIADPIWRGSLYLCNPSIGSVSGLLAHLSSLACSKVLDETRLFPEVLCADLLQRSAVWPKGFKNCGPTDQSIALYLFPENERSEKAFDKLVDDIIRLDLAMRAVVENAELLVFPSTVLPIRYWRFQAKYYLWGVFRAKQTLPKTNDIVCGEDSGGSKPLTGHKRSPSNTLRNSGSYGFNAQYSSASRH